MNLKQYRKELGVTIKEASSACNVPVRTYVRYENDNDYGNKLKRNQIYISLKNRFEISEDKGLLSIEIIKDKVSRVLSKYIDNVSFCYLFGSYAKGYAKETSDVDLCVSTTLTGLSFVGMIEELHMALNKNVDVLRLNDLKNNEELLKEIMKDGVKIYG